MAGFRCGFCGRDRVQAPGQFEPLWRRETIANIQITIAEELGVEKRGGFYDHTGALRDMVQKLSGRAELPEVALPASVKATLRPYQQQGVNWLQFLRGYGLAGILADDMGLGKTLQTLAHIQIEKDAGRLTEPALIIAPVSLMGNWRREAERFCPDLRALVIHGKDRHVVAGTMAEFDVVIAPYSLSLIHI